ncbi:uncharacterized protein LOC120351566 [Nilaparvata lugens]|uniref:uncharacterized protein LOC120351566 n=1 Tax=Nilaparvata lugens TaxID=108931 RepID=UPI00193D0146|nr:uncharacterized protein LOC120351566 [Nilaparvata lugens]
MSPITVSCFLSILVVSPAIIFSLAAGNSSNVDFTESVIETPEYAMYNLTGNETICPFTEKFTEIGITGTSISIFLNEYSCVEPENKTINNSVGRRIGGYACVQAINTIYIKMSNTSEPLEQTIKTGCIGRKQEDASPLFVSPPTTSS